MNATAHVLTVLGVLGIAEFVLLGFCSHRLAETTVPRLRRRVNTPLVHYAPAWTAVSALVLAAGLIVGAQ